MRRWIFAGLACPPPRLATMQIAKGTVASINYKVSTVEGEHVDASEPGKPLVFLCGVGQIIVGLESALIGKQAGDAVVVDVAPEHAYGRRDPGLDLAVPLDAFPEEVRGQLRAGMQFHADHPSKAGETVLFTIHGRRDQEVLVSGNHPLADKALHFEVTVDSVRAASKEELEHGHAHGAGGHHH
jgi:FKBP-type peptidyl-prolyl cis-trans isomerase SlyD